MVAVPSDFRAALDTYRGPLDLLLYLIKKDEVDIFDIPIAKVVEQYGIYLEVLKQIDPNVCGEFLVMAARLMEIKSKLLLPREELQDDLEDLEDPRLELVRQLLEYKKYKERALLLERRFLEYSRRYRREPGALADDEPEDPSAPVPLGNVSVWDLLTAFHRLQVALGHRGPHRVVYTERPVSEYMDAVVATLSSAAGQSASFESLFEGFSSRYDAIGLFLAILELAKMYRVYFEQEETFGPIQVTLRELSEAEAMSNMDIPTADLAADAAVRGADSQLGEDPTAELFVRGEGDEARRERHSATESEAVADQETVPDPEPPEPPESPKPPEPPENS